MENSNTTTDSSIRELVATEQEVTRGAGGQPVDRFDFLSDAEVVWRETEDGEDRRALVSDLFRMQQTTSQSIWLKLCAYDKYGYKVHAWRPCRLGLCGYVDVP